MQRIGGSRALVKLVCKQCGREFEVIKFKNNRTEADSFEEWAKENINICKECYATQNLINLEKENELPELSGSEKQIKWARDIRSQMVKEYKDELHYKTLDQSVQEKFNNVFKNIISSKTYIDNRYLKWHEFCKKFIES